MGGVQGAITFTSKPDSGALRRPLSQLICGHNGLGATVEKSKEQQECCCFRISLKPWFAGQSTHECLLWTEVGPSKRARCDCLRSRTRGLLQGRRWHWGRPGFPEPEKETIGSATGRKYQPHQGRCRVRLQRWGGLHQPTKTAQWEKGPREQRDSNSSEYSHWRPFPTISSPTSLPLHLGPWKGSGLSCARSPQAAGLQQTVLGKRWCNSDVSRFFFYYSRQDALITDKTTSSYLKMVRKVMGLTLNLI